jgi:ABC-type sugar transport system permease subunit
MRVEATMPTRPDVGRLGEGAAVGTLDLPGAGARRRRPRWRSRRARDAAAAYAFLSPWIVGLLFITVGPMLFSLYLAFTSYDLLSAPHWIGLDNFKRMFTADPRYTASVRATLIYVGASVPLLLVVSMVLALLLHRGMRFLSAYRALFYLPSLLGTSVAVAVLWRQVFGDRGILNHALAKLGVDHGSWIGDPATALYTIVALNLWAFGATMIIFLAGLRQVPREFYEAAAVDGAGQLRRFWHITLPMMSPLIFFNLLLDTVHAFQAFTGAYVVSQGTGGPADSTLFYTLYLYEQGFAQLHMGYAAAMAWTLVIVLAGFTAFLFLTARFWVHYGDER